MRHSQELPVFCTVLQFTFVGQVTSVETFLAVFSASLVKIKQTAVKGGSRVLFFIKCYINYYCVTEQKCFLEVCTKT